MDSNFLQTVVAIDKSEASSEMVFVDSHNSGTNNKD